ncbi:MAG: phosphate ABC transporter permease PstA [Conexibacteraceae bacterium]|nr:phosphate ABC transporter permease PstA [Conexibacteraceae bacterium]
MSAIPDPAYALTPSGNLRRRLLVSRICVGGAVAAAAIAVAVLVILVYYVLKQGISVISFSFFTEGLQTPLPTDTHPVGGIAPALVGTIIMVLFATAIALPIGVLTALYLSEFAGPRTNQVVRLMLDLMAGLPTIISGIFIAVLITNSLGESALAAGVALSIIEVPLIARASLESITRVPDTMREAADALGVARWRSILGVILPTAASGIVTATILAVARAAGETAPLLFTTAVFNANGGVSVNPLTSLASVPLLIFQRLELGYPSSIAQAWGLAFTLMIVILAANIGARLWLRRSERKRGV